MGLFKSKAEKEMERRALVRKTIRSIEKYVSQLQDQKSQAIKSAREAKAQGSKQMYNLALSAIKTAMAQEKKAREMLLNFQIASQMRDLSAMTAGFLDGMSVLSKEMKEITGDMNFAKVQKQFSEAMQGVEETTDNIDAMLDNTDMAFGAISSAMGDIPDSELESLIGNLDDDATDIEGDIDAKLAELEKRLTD